MKDVALPAHELPKLTPCSAWVPSSASDAREAYLQQIPYLEAVNAASSTGWLPSHEFHMESGLIRKECRGDLKQAVTSEIHRRSGLVPTYSIRHMDGWADSATEFYSGGLQLAAIEKFPIRATAEVMARTGVSSLLPGVIVPWHSRAVEKATEFLDATYAWTQDFLAEKGIKEMLLFRGVQFKTEGELPGWARDLMGSREASVATLEAYPLSSFSADASVGAAFANTRKSRGLAGFIVSARVPASRIASLPMTGLGCLTEGEAVVIGGEMECAVASVPAYQRWGANAVPAYGKHAPAKWRWTAPKPGPWPSP